MTYTHLISEIKKYRNRTALSTYIWEQKNNKINTNIKWEILSKCNTYKAGSKRCDLCLTEKLVTMKKEGTLNKRFELMKSE